MFLSFIWINKQTNKQTGILSNGVFNATQASDSGCQPSCFMMWHAAILGCLHIGEFVHYIAFFFGGEDLVLTRTYFLSSHLKNGQLNIQGCHYVEFEEGWGVHITQPYSRILSSHLNLVTMFASFCIFLFGWAESS